jgi:NAD-dependent SIR2 family protein deacetylase
MTPLHHNEQIQRAAQLIFDASGILIVAGAGIGIDSGLPDFRGQAGFWKAYPALGRDGLNFTDIACPEAFHHHPKQAWGFYGHRLALYRTTQPHAGFSILHRWMNQSSQGAAIFTSNVDGQFQKAGFDEQRILECHGSLHYLQCLDRCHTDIWSADAFLPDVDEDNCLLRGELPRCLHCGGLARPNVFMFDDATWLAQRTRSQQHRLHQWIRDVNRLVVIEIGAGTAINTARAFSQRMAYERYAPVIRINPDDSSIYGDPNHVSLPMGALQALEAIDHYLMPSLAA